jgi:hypothetical protein
MGATEMSTPPLPAGFTLDKSPALPAGFMFDAEQQQSPQRSLLQSAARQAGLTARAGVQGLGGLVGLVTDPVAGLINTITPEDAPKAARARDLAAQLANVLGLPSPESAIERVVGQAAESMAGAGGTVAAARGLAGGFGAVGQSVAGQLAAQPLQQVAGAAGAGAGAQTAREMGGGTAAQLAAGLAGGVAGSGAASLGQRMATRAPTPAIVREAEAAGVPLMSSDVVPPRTFAGRFMQATGEKIPIAGTGGMRSAQQEARQAAVKNLVEDFGADVGTKFDERVAADLLKKRSGLLTRYTDMKQRAMQSAGTAPVAVNRAVAQIDQELADLAAMGPAAERTGVVSLLEDFKASLQGQPITRLDEVRKLLGDQITSPQLGVPRDLAAKIPSRVYAALRQDMAEHIKQQGGDRAAREWTVANGSLSSLMRETDNGRLKLALNTGSETPETVRALLFSTKPSDMRALYRNLTPQGRQAAQAAVLQKALQDAARDGLDNLSPKVFANQLRKLGDQVGVFFPEVDREKVEGLRRVLIATQRAGEAAAAPPTGVQAVPFFGGAFLADMLGGAGAATAGAVTAGGLARVLESKPMRGLLIKMAATKPGSAEEASLLKRIMSASQAAQPDTESQP